MANRATREAYGETLIELVEEGLNVVAVDADLAGSTQTGKLGAYDPDRLINVGIAEQDMMGVAAGLSLTGRIAFTGSFAVFGTGRCYDQIRNTVCDAKLNVKVCPTHAGITVGEDGATHQMLEDIGMMRALPQMRVLVPADYRAAKAAIRIAATTEGPVYVRLGRHKVPEVYDETFTGGLPYAGVLREGGDVTLAACGVEVAQALAAADLLAEKGISAEVIDAFSVKPLDGATILESVAKTRCVVTAEEHSVIGGLGSAVCELLAGAGPVYVECVAVRDRFGKSGEFEELLGYFNIDATAIVEAVKKVRERAGLC